MDVQIKWAKKQKKFFDYETRNKMRSKTIILILTVAVIAMVIVFWGDIKKASGRQPGGSRQAIASVQTEDDATESISPGVTIVTKWDLPSVLAEISGLSYISDERFACVQDELGKVFIYNTQSSTIEKEVPFAGAGDFEGIAVVNNDVWVVRADGALFEISNFTTKPAVKEYKTHLTAEQNVEGLCYDKKNNRLLIAIKDEEPGDVNYKGIYKFDLGSKQMPEQPAMKINLNDAIFERATDKKKKKNAVMKPSAIAVHPVSGDIYISDGPKAKLLVMTGSGAIKKLYHLDDKKFRQPEGVTFNMDGDMFISNEGSKGGGNILQVEIQE